MPNPEFWYEESASELTLRGPGVTIALTRANSIEHSLVLTIPSLTQGDLGVLRPLVHIDATAQAHDTRPDPRRVFNPVYQEMVPHELPSDLRPGLCMLLTGSSFEHHFSAVFSLRRDRAMPSRVVFDVEVADRCRAPIEKLAATYDIRHQHATPSLVDARPGALAWQFGSHDRGSVELQALPPAVIGEPTLTGPPTRVQIDATIDPHTHTQRLHYRWRWTS